MSFSPRPLAFSLPLADPLALAAPLAGCVYPGVQVLGRMTPSIEGDEARPARESLRDYGGGGSMADLWEEGRTTGPSAVWRERICGGMVGGEERLVMLIF